MRSLRKTTAERRQLIVLASATLAFSVLLFASSCEDLTTDDVDLTSTTLEATGTTVEAPTLTMTTAPRTATTEDDGPVPFGDEATDTTGMGMIGTAVPFTTETTEDRSIGERWVFDESDHNHRVEMSVRDHIAVTLSYPRLARVAYTTWHGSPLMGNFAFDEDRSLLGDHVTDTAYEFIVLEEGTQYLMIVSYYADDSVHDIWQILVIATE